MTCDGVTLVVKFSSGSLDLFLSEGRIFSQPRESDDAFGCHTGLVSHYALLSSFFLFCLFVCLFVFFNKVEYIFIYLNIYLKCN